MQTGMLYCVLFYVVYNVYKQTNIFIIFSVNFLNEWNQNPVLYS